MAFRSLQNSQPRHRYSHLTALGGFVGQALTADERKCSRFGNSTLASYSPQAVGDWVDDSYGDELPYLSVEPSMANDGIDTRISPRTRARQGRPSRPMLAKD